MSGLPPRRQYQVESAADAIVIGVSHASPPEKTSRVSETLETLDVSRNRTAPRPANNKRERTFRLRQDAIVLLSRKIQDRYNALRPEDQKKLTLDESAEIAIRYLADQDDSDLRRIVAQLCKE